MTVRANGQPAAGVTATVGDKTYTSDSQGVVTVEAATGVVVVFSRADAFPTEATTTEGATFPLVLRQDGATEELVDQLLYRSTTKAGRSPLMLLRERADFVPDSAISASPTALHVLNEAVAYISRYTPPMSVTSPSVPSDPDGFGASINADRVTSAGADAVAVAAMRISGSNVVVGCQIYFKELRWAIDPATARHELGHCAGLGHGPIGGLMCAECAGGPAGFSTTEDYLLREAYVYLSPGFTYLFRTPGRSGIPARTSGVRTIVIVD